MSAPVSRAAPPGGPGASLDRVTRALANYGPGRRAGEWTKYHCPVPSHGSGKGDRDPSLGVLYDAGKGRTKVECFSGCSDVAVLDVIGLSVADLFDEPLSKSTGGGRSSNGLIELPDRRTATAKKKPATARKPAGGKEPTSVPAGGGVKRVKGALGKVVETYEYPDARGERHGRVLRYEPKDFRPQRWDPETKRWKFGGFDAILYRLPEVIKAIATREPIYLVEGEKDAKTAVRCGLTGTCNAGGGGRGHFLAGHAEQLRGAHVVVVVDRDKTGYEHGVEVLERLDGIAASVRVVCGRAGKDFTDHVEAGGDVDDLQEVDPAAALAEITGEEPPVDPPLSEPPTDGGEPPSGTPEVPNRLPEFIYRQGETVQVRRDRSGRVTAFDAIWRCEVSTLDQLVDDNGDPLAPPAGGGWWLQLRRHRLDEETGVAQRDEAGELVWDEAEVHLPAETIRDGSWHEHLPWPGIVHDLSQKGRTTALQAANLVARMPRERARRYVATGWRTDSDGQDMFVHAGGGITAGGVVPLPYVAIDGKLAVFRMSEPTTEGQRLREAVRDGLAPLVHLPGSVLAPVIGFAMRSIFGAPHTSLHLVGNPGSGKTAISRIAGMHWFAPDMRENGPGARKEVFSALEDVGDSVKGLLDRMSAACDLPVTIDDFKGTKGAAKLSQIQSAIWNGGDRTLGTRTGGHRTTGAPRCSGITTGELSSTGSSATRALTVRVESSMLSLTAEDGKVEEVSDVMGRLERKASRYARGLLGSSFIQWVAGQRQTLTSWIEGLEEESPYIDAWNAICSRMEHESGVRGRLVRTSMVCTSGWIALLTWLRSAEAITDEEAELIWNWAMDGLHQQLQQQDPSSVDGPRHMLDLLRAALLSGSCHLSSQQGGVPDDVKSATHPDGGVVYGWSPRTSITGPSATDGFINDQVIWQARGDRVGILTDTEVWLVPRMVLGVATNLATRAGESFPHTSVSLGAAMSGRGWIQANGAGDRSMNRRIASMQQRVWVMPRHILDGVDDEGRPSGDDPTPPTLPPPPWQTSGAAEPQPESSGDDGRDDETPEQQAGESADPVQELNEPVPESRAVRLPAADQMPGADQVPAAPQGEREHVESGLSMPSAGDERWLAAAAVVTAEELILPDGTRVHLADEITHIGHLAELATELRLGHGGGKHVLPSAGQLWLTAEAMDRFGITVDKVNLEDPEAVSAAIAVAGAEQATAAVADGWKLSGQDEVRVWTRVWRPKTDEQRAVSVQLVLAPLVGAFDDAQALTKDGPAPEALARRAQMVADALGVTWGASGGVTGLNLLRKLRPPRNTSGRASLAATDYVAPPAPMRKDPARVPNTALLWCRAASPDELGRGFIHAYDANAMYLAAQGATEVGVGEPEHHEKDVGFSPKVAGLWRINPGEADDWRLPDITRPAGRLPGTTGWYTTPVIRYLIDELGQDPQILEAYTWPGSTRRYFVQWYEVVRDARAAMMAAGEDPDAAVVLSAIKQVYARTVGRLARTEDGRAESPLYRPDWRLAIVSTANANLLRKLRRAGQQSDTWPVAISTDEVFYLSDEQKVRNAVPKPLRLSPKDGPLKLGEFKPTRTAEVGEELRSVLRRGKLSELLAAIPKRDDL